MKIAITSSAHRQSKHCSFFRPFRKTTAFRSAASRFQESTHYRVALLPLAARLPLRGSLLLSWEMCRYWHCSPFSRVCPRYSNKPMGAYIYLFFLSLPASSFYSVSASWNSLCQDEATLRASLDVERSLIGSCSCGKATPNCCT